MSRVHLIRVSAWAIALFSPLFCFAATTRIILLDGATGQPIAGAQISRMPSSEIPAEAVPIARTDEAGAVVLEVDPAQRTGLLATASGHGPLMFGFWGAVPRTDQLRMKRAKIWSGRVVGSDGRPAANATVELVYKSVPILRAFVWRNTPPLSLLRATRTDADGRFSFALDPSDFPPVLRAHDDQGHGAILLTGTCVATEKNPGGSLNDLDLRLGVLPPQPQEPGGHPAESSKPTLTIHLTVVDDATGKPLDDVRVTPGGSSSPDQRIYLRERGTLRFVDEPIAWSFYDDAWAYILQVQADGYATTPTRIIKGSERTANVVLRLKRPRRLTLKIRTPDGAPAAAARLYLSTPTQTLNLETNPQPWDPPASAVASAQGVVTLALPDEPCRFALVHDAGWAEGDVTSGNLAPVTLQRWSTATIRLGRGDLSRPAEIQEQSGYSQQGDCWIDFSSTVFFDSSGIAVVRCKPGNFLGYILAMDYSGSEAVNPTANWSSFEIQLYPLLKPGDQRDFDVMDGQGGVRAQLQDVPGRRWGFIYLQQTGDLPKPATAPITTRPANSAPRTQPAADPTPQAFVTSIMLKPTVTGEIGALGLTPGIYRLFASASTDIAAGSTEPPITLQRDFTESQKGGAIDLGTLRPDAIPKGDFVVGDSAPALRAGTLDGKSFDLAGLRGKWVLLDFWGTWCGFCVAEYPTYRDAYEGWGMDGRLTLVSISVDDTPDAVRQYLITHDMPWTQVVLGDRHKTDIPRHFNVTGYPSVMLISPDGKLVASDLRGGTLRDALIQFLGPPAPPSTTGVKPRSR